MRGGDSVFPTRNGCPKVLAKYVDNPYSYELLPEYESGEKSLPKSKAPYWDGKDATCRVIRQFCKDTPIVSPCKYPLCISRLVVVPKYAPGQSKDDPNYGFRVCVNSLYNKCLKPVASTIRLAAGEIRKLHHCKYYLQVDGMNAFWAIPICEKSQRLSAFHTPDGVMCFNRLVMGSQPAPTVQQSAYIEALNQYLDIGEEGNPRLDAEGNPLNLARKFAVYCDDIAAGANTLEELYVMFVALVSALKRAHIQVKAAKVKFGVSEVTFHNYTISAEGTKPKEENLNPIRNMTQPRDVSQLRAFLGCCQQLSNYVKGYAIIAQPLHQLTKKSAIFPKPWVPGSLYDISFHRMKSAMLDSPKYLWNKDSTKRLYIETDASDLGWGACAYQFECSVPPGTEGEGRYRLAHHMDKPKRVVEWLSKA